MLSPYAKSEWLTILIAGALLAITSLILGWWWLTILLVLLTIALLLFFRDPDRRTPTQRGIMVAPADGVVSSIHELEHFEPFDGPAMCIRIFLSVLDVHINRCPCHGIVTSIVHTPGQHRNALNPDSAESNENNLIVLEHPIRRHKVAAIRQVSGMLARTIHCGIREDQTIQRGQRIGMIKLGSTTELYIPHTLEPKPAVEQGQKVQGGLTVLANITPLENTDIKINITRPEKVTA